MNIIELKKSNIFTLNEIFGASHSESEALEKALFKHAYYSRLIPTVILGKDGVKRIHWVNPNKDAKKTTKTKLNLVGHFLGGDRADHHKQIESDNDIDLNLLHHFSHGDKVRITKGPKKGEIGIFVGSHTTKGNASPRTSVKFEDKNGAWKGSDPIGVGNLELVHRKTDDTLKAIAPKTVMVKNRKGKDMIVSKDWALKQSGIPAKETYKARHERLNKEIAKGVMFQRVSDEVKVFISNVTDTSYHIKIMNAAAGTKQQGFVPKERFQKMVENGAYIRAGLSETPKDTKDKKLSRQLETGELHVNGKMSYDNHGNAVLDPDVKQAIIFENWAYIERVVNTEVQKYPTVDPSEISGVDLIDKIANAVETFEPFLAPTLQARLHQYVKDATAKKAQQLHQINILRDRKDMMTDTSATISGSTIEEDPQGTTDDIGGGAFVNMLDVLIFHEILADEADMMSWYADNDEYADVLMRMTGLGVGEASITKGEAATELHGKLMNSFGQPFAKKTIELQLAKDTLKMLKAYKDEADQDPEFAHTLKQAIQYRSKMKRKREITGVDAKDYPTIKAVQEKYDGGRSARASIAQKLIKHGSNVAYVPKMVSMVEDIVDGKLFPGDYNKRIPTEFHAEILDATLKDMIPTTSKKVPDRFEVKDWYRYNPNDKTLSTAWLTSKLTPPTKK